MVVKSYIKREEGSKTRTELSVKQKKSCIILQVKLFKKACTALRPSSNYQLVIKEHLIRLYKNVTFLYVHDRSLFFSETMTANWARDANDQNCFTGKKNASLMNMESGEYRDFPKFCGLICYKQDYLASLPFKI